MRGIARLGVVVAAASLAVGVPITAGVVRPHRVAEEQSRGAEGQRRLVESMQESVRAARPDQDHPEGFLCATPDPHVWYREKDRRLVDGQGHLYARVAGARMHGAELDGVVLRGIK